MKSNNTIFFEHYLGVPFDKLYLIKSVKCFRGTKEFPSVEGLFQYNVLFKFHQFIKVFKGQTIELSGFIMKGDSLMKAITCCISYDNP